MNFLLFRKMSKRRYESNANLDQLVVEYLKKRNCKKSLLLFQNHIDPMRRNSSLSNNLFAKFEEFLRHKSQESQIEDDLGFEINFASFQNEPKVSRMKFLIRPSSFQK